MSAFPALKGIAMLSNHQTDANLWHECSNTGCQMSIFPKITPTFTISIHFQAALKVFPRRFFFPLVLMKLRTEFKEGICAERKWWNQEVELEARIIKG